MAIIRTTVVLPERENPFFTKMASLLPREIFNVSNDYIIPRLHPVTVTGTVVPFSTVVVSVNGVNQSPVPDIVADANGFWSTTVRLGPGQNTIEVEFFPPVATEENDNAYTPTLLVDTALVHPTLFSPFPMQNTLNMVLLDGSYLYVGNYIPPPNDTKTLARFDTTTGSSIVLDELATTPTSGRVFFMAKDSNWLYVSQTMGDASIKLSRYAKDLSARTDITTFAQPPTALYSDGSHLFATRNSGTDVLLSKIDPATFTVMGSPVSLKAGNIGEFMVSGNAMDDDGVNLMIPVSVQIFLSGDSPGNEIQEGTPPINDFIILKQTYHRKIVKSTMADAGLHNLYICYPSSGFVASKNSMVSFGGFHYTVAQSNPGRVIKMQEQLINTQRYLIPVELTPLPFSTVDGDQDNAQIPKMKLGPDSRLYVVGTNHIARFTPGSSSMQVIARGKHSIDATLSEIAIIDDATPTRAIGAPITIFSDRSTTFNVTTPASPPANLRCHWNATYTSAAVAWDAPSDGSGVIVEMSHNGDGFLPCKSEYWGNATYMLLHDLQVGRPFDVFQAGDTLTFRAKFFNLVGQSGYSSTAVVSIPFRQPPINDQLTLSVTGRDAFSVSLQWQDTEIDLSHPGQVGTNYNRFHTVGVYRSTDNFTSNNVKVGTVSNAQTNFPYNATSDILTFTDTTAQPATTYFYKVRGESTTYAPSNYSNVVSQATFSIFPLTAPDALMSVTMPASEVDTTLTLNLTDLSIGPTQDTNFGNSLRVARTNGADLMWAGVGNNTGGLNPVLYRVDYGSHTVTGADFAAAQIAYDGTNIWVVNQSGALHKLNPTTLADLGTAFNGTLVSVFWDGTDLWTLSVDGSVGHVNRAGPTITNLGNGGNFPGPEIPFVGNCQFGIVKIGGFVYAMVNGVREVTVFGHPLRPIRALKIDPAGPTVVGTVDSQLSSCVCLYTDGTHLIYLDGTPESPASSKVLLWIVDPATGNPINVINTGMADFDVFPQPFEDNTALLFNNKKIPFADTQYYQIDSAQDAQIAVNTNFVDFWQYPVLGVGTHVEFKRYARSSYESHVADNPIQMPIPADPTSFNSSTSGQNVNLTWTDNASGHALYKVERQTASGPFSTLAIVSPVSNAYSDTNPPGGGPMLTYRLTAFNQGQSSASVTTTIQSPNTDFVIQINTANAGHVAYATSGTDTWAAFDANGTVFAKKIDSSLNVTDFTLQVGNGGGPIKRLLSDGTNIYTVSLGVAATPPPGMVASRPSGMSITLLPSGKVLVAGGFNLSSAELYDPVADTWTATGSMSTVRSGHTATLLPNGKVLVAGGFTSGTYLSSAEIYDPTLGTWSSTGSMSTTRNQFTATLLGNGKVLVVGGFNGSYLTGAELYDPAFGTWSSTGSLSLVGRAIHTENLLGNGKVLVSGGFTTSNYLSSCELYDPTLGTWSATGSFTTGTRYYHTATLLNNGKVLMAGGASNPGYLSSAELYDPTAGTWSATGSLITARGYHTATLLASGKVLVAAGDGNLTSAELYDPTAGTFATTGSLTYGRNSHVAVRLQNNNVLVAGAASNTYEVYSNTLFTWSTPTGGAAKPITIRKYTTGGVFVAGFTFAAITNDATIGNGFIWFTVNSANTTLKKLSTSDMTTLTSFGYTGTFNPFFTVDYDSITNKVFATDTGFEAGNHGYGAFNPTTDVSITNQSPGAQFNSLDAEAGIYTPTSLPILYVVDSADIEGYRQSDLSRILIGANNSIPQNKFKSIFFDTGTNNLYGIYGGSPGAVYKFSNAIATLDSKVKNLTVGQDDNFVRNNGKVFVTITDLTATSGLSILTMIF
jgi:hypothetical protein